MNEQENADDPADNAGVVVPPPFIFASLLLLGLWYDSPWFDGQMTGVLQWIAGAALVLPGLALMMASVPNHKKSGSNVEPWKPTTTILTTGAYGISRNPIYLGMALVHAGLAVAGASLAALVTLIFAVLAVRFYVIASEEDYLERKFGDVYLEYKSKVRRWI